MEFLTQETIRQWADQIMEWHGEREDGMIKKRIIFHNGVKRIVQLIQPHEDLTPIVKVWVSSDFGMVQVDEFKGTWNGVSFCTKNVDDLDLYEKINVACAEMAR
jgi:hypothetical protein